MNKDKILIVDDDPHVCKLMGRVLQKENYDTVWAENGKKGLEMIESESPDLVILDLTMPEMSGEEMLDFSLKSHPELPVIIVTAFGSEQKAVKLLKGGAVDYLRKPFNIEELVIKVREAMEKNRLMAARERFNQQIAETAEDLLLQMEMAAENPYGVRHIFLAFTATFIGSIIGLYLSLGCTLNFHDGFLRLAAYLFSW
jgi:DNA-binding response OmpR family regulator